MSAQTWRVVLASGEVRKVLAEPCALGWRVDRGPLRVTGASPVSAVAAAVNAMNWSAVEILAPGQLTRAELRVAAWREGAEAAREDALEFLSLRADDMGRKHRDRDLIAQVVLNDAAEALESRPLPEVSR